MFPWILLATAQAQSTLHVPSEFETVQAAVIAANDGDTIEIDASDAYARDPDNDVLVGKDLLFRGVNGHPKLPRLNVVASDVTIESATLQGVDRLFDAIGVDVAVFVASGSLTLTDVNLRSLNGNSVGIVSVGGALTLDTVNAIDFWSAPVVQITGARLDVIDSLFQYNYDGTLQASDSDVSVIGSQFEGNFAYSGADISATSSSQHALLIDGTRFDFSTSDYGGAVYSDHMALTVVASDFTDCWGYSNGGAILATGDANAPVPLLIEDSSFLRSFSPEGGALALGHLQDGLISGGSFTNNAADQGGAIAFQSGTLQVEGALFSRNTATWSGGAIRTQLELLGADPAAGIPTSLNVVDSTFEGRPQVNDALSGGCLYGMLGTELAISGSTFDSCGADFEGGAISFSGTKLDISDSTFQGSTAFIGGALYQAGGALSLYRSTVLESEADLGGAITTASTSNDIAWNWFTDNTATSTSVVELTDAVGLELIGNRFCHNTALTSGSITQVTGAEGGPFHVTNNVWLFNDSDLGAAFRSVPSDWLLNNGPAVKILNNDLVGNRTSTGVAFRGSVDVRNNIFAGQPIGLLQEQGLNGSAIGGWNLWLDNGANAQGTAGLFPTPTDLRDTDPLFQGLVADDCSSNLWLQHDSLARDAGDPDLFDPDGTRSDIGAFGGPDSGLGDADGDGVFEDLDCNDLDPAVSPELPDIPYDGIDNDCDGIDLCDGDGDGFDSSDCGGPDCDDADPEVHPKARDLPDDGLDSDCDGFEPRTWLGGGGGCGADHTGGLPTAAWVLALLALGRRRR